MTGKCKVCSSPHREEYERLRLREKKTYMELSEIAATKYGEFIHWTAFRRHMTRHCLPYIEHEIKTNKLRKEIIQAQIKKDILIAQQLTEALEICRNKIQEKLQKEQLDETDEKLLLEYIEEARLIIEALLKWSKELKFEETSEQDLERRIIECIKDFPPDLIQLFLERWKSYGSNK
jgi:DNA repair exonuclease SbcCD ATPase subunit